MTGINEWKLFSLNIYIYLLFSIVSEYSAAVKLLVKEFVQGGIATVFLSFAKQ